MSSFIDAIELLGRYSVGERDFSGANLKTINLKDADLKGIVLQRANLSEANFLESDLTEADMRDGLLVSTISSLLLVPALYVVVKNLTDSESR